MGKRSLVSVTVAFLTLVTFAGVMPAAPPASTSETALQLSPVPIDVAHAPAPLFDDEAFHGASDPFVI